ncbi:MAG: hypothetical protein DSZ27_05870 [Thiomicrospira sp.]|nr:MAG: hypothetical protein DSZ27_05870 [Thiomicrospira sp.]
MNIRSIVLLTCIISLFFSRVSHAEETLPNVNQIEFSVTQSQQVTNDLVTVRLIAQAEHQEANIVQRQINQKMHHAQRILNRYPEITATTQDYRVVPVYDDHQKIQHWKGQQILNLTLKNQPGLADILTKLQPYLNYNDMQFSISEAQREQTMTSLLTSALAQYQTKAKLIADAFGQSVYHFTQTHIQQSPAPHPYRMTQNIYTAKMTSKEVSPVIETGESRLSITVSGRMLISNQKK